MNKNDTTSQHNTVTTLQLMAGRGMNRRRIGAASAGIFLLAAALPCAAEPDPASDKPVVEQLVDAMTTLAHGPYAGFRANHAKGIMVSGKFVPAPGASAFSKAPQLQKATPVIARFSDATGVPVIPDADPNASPHGLAIRFQLPGGDIADIVSISANGFPASTPEDFLAFLHAIAASGPGVPKPTPVEQFIGSHPGTQRFVSLPMQPPQSFATQAFFGVNAFRFTNAKGESHYGRYRIVPLAGEHSLPADQAKSAAPDYLMQELPAHLKTGPVKFKLLVQVAEKDDVTSDANAIWPETRRQVELGVLTFDKVLPDSQKLEKTVLFSPLNLPDGIAASDDPILLARPAAYSISFGRRSGN